jgi:cyclohexyl-isocyanide hydratase
VQLIGHERGVPVTAFNGASLTTHASFSELAQTQLDVTFVPGGGDAYLDVAMKDAELLDFVRRQAGGAAWVVSVCSGAHRGIDETLSLIGAIAGEQVGRDIDLIIQYRPQPPYGVGDPSVATMRRGTRSSPIFHRRDRQSSLSSAHPMRSTLAALMLLVPAMAIAADTVKKPLSIQLELLGDRDREVVARVFFRFANPRAMTAAGLFVEGSLKQAGEIPRNFRFRVPRDRDRFIWNNSFEWNGKLVRLTQWSLLPDQRNELALGHRFLEGEAEIEARLILEGDRDNPARLIAEASEKIAFEKPIAPFPSKWRRNPPNPRLCPRSRSARRAASASRRSTPSSSTCRRT